MRQPLSAQQARNIEEFVEGVDWRLNGPNKLRERFSKIEKELREGGKIDAALEEIGIELDRSRLTARRLLLSPIKPRTRTRIGCKNRDSAPEGSSETADSQIEDAPSDSESRVGRNVSFNEPKLSIEDFEQRAFQEGEDRLPPVHGLANPRSPRFLALYAKRLGVSLADFAAAMNEEPGLP